MQKEVKINGLKINQQFGILEICELIFDPKIGMYVTKGKSGHGKSHITTALKLATQGSNALDDNQKYGIIDLEVPLTDGDMPIWIGCKSNGKSLAYVLYIKDKNGKKVKNPIIDGVKATPSSYMSHLQTELTWNMNKLTSENPSIQKKILLKLYQSQLQKIGVIFDTKHLDYSKSILGKIDSAVKDRDLMDYHRKQNGGIADDLKAQGFDPDRPDTCPDYINVSEIDEKIKELEKEKILLTSSPEEKKKTKLAEIKAKAMEVTNKCLAYNSELGNTHKEKINIYNGYWDKVNELHSDVSELKKILEKLNISHHLGTLENDIKYPDKINEPETAYLIQFDENNQVAKSDNLDQAGKDLIAKIVQLRKFYKETANEPLNTDTTELDSKILSLETTKTNAAGQNKIVDAIDSFHKWRAANETVVQLKDKYVKLLSQVETGVEGLEIQPIDDDIFLMYNGAYDVDYFQPKHKKLEMRKLSSYSSTQKPVICLLIQNYLLSKKSKAMRYLHIDNIPIDNTSRELLEKISKNLNVHIFLNITGDFEKKKLQAGEILIEGGEVFF